MSQLKNIKRWIERISDSSSSDAVVIDALMKVRPYSKKQSGIRDIEQTGGVECFLNLIQKPNKRMLDISISLLANCLTQESVRKKVFESQGVLRIVKLLQSIKCNTILTRTCRSIANLANNVECSKTLHAVGTIDLIVQLIKLPSTPSDCLASALRAIKNLANSPGHRKKLIEHGVVSVLNKTLKTCEKDALPASLLALAEISKSCTIEFADHMLGNDGAPIRTLVEIIGDPPDVSCKKNALSVIVILTIQGCARPTIGNVGGLKCIVDEIKKITDIIYLESDKEPIQGPLPENASRLVGAVCYCCREAINRARLRSMDALPIFIQLLYDNRWASMHHFILTTLLCFLYDEEGLKALHDCGLFAVLLEELQSYTMLERESFEETSTNKLVWDGHDIDNDENFDRRQSLSCDIPTKFNQRPTVSAVTDGMETTFEALAFDWRKKEEIASYSPQWSPAGPSPIPSDLAYADDSSPPVTPRAISPSDLQSLESRLVIAAGNQGDENPSTIPSDHIHDEDDSSSSRESFDQMHSPALLPATGRFNVFPENLETLFMETPGTNKRDRVSSNSSQGSKASNRSLDEDLDMEVDFDTRMRKDLRQPPKRAKIDNLKYSGNDRIRSRSLDTTASNQKVNSKVHGTAVDIKTTEQTGPSSPPSEYMLREIASTACSPKFLRFVNETCSASPQLLKHAGRETLGSSSSVGAPLMKQPKRRTSGASKKLEEIADGSLSNPPAEESVMDNKDKVTPKLIKTSSNPLPVGKEKVTSVDPTDDSNLTGPEPVTPVQVILCLLCHYCEVSENYIVSLALQDNCGEALALYMRECPKALDPKFGKIVDKLSGSTKCFSKMVSASLVPLLTSTAVLRIQTSVPSFHSENQVICDLCGKDVSIDCISLVNNAWHNTALCHSSSYGSHLLKALLTKGTEPEAATSMCVVVLLFLWYWEGSEFKTMSDELHKRLISNLLAIIDKNRLEMICKVLQEFPYASKEFQCVAYVFHKLTNISYREITMNLCVDKSEKSETESSSNQSQKVLSFVTENNSGQDRKPKCAYTRYCKMQKPDRVLAFSQPQNISSPESRLRRRKCRGKKSVSKVESSELPVHSDVLSEKSPMFAAMFQGRYKESTEKIVTIQDVSYRTALYILHNMYGCNPAECVTMKVLLQEMKNSSSTRYELFCASCRDKSGCIPWEIDVLRVMDLWLLSDARKDFHQKHKRFFCESYIASEISTLADGIRQMDFEKKTGISSDDDGSQCSPDRMVEDNNVVQNCCFLDFLNDHGFRDMAQEYVLSFFRPCLFNHNHLLHAKVFGHIVATSSSGENFVKIVLENISFTFSKLVQQLQASHTLD